MTKSKRQTEHEDPRRNPSGNPTFLLINTFQALISTPTGFLHLDEFISSKKTKSTYEKTNSKKKVIRLSKELIRIMENTLILLFFSFYTLYTFLNQPTESIEKNISVIFGPFGLVLS
jgi:hypothetical protein